MRTLFIFAIAVAFSTTLQVHAHEPHGVSVAQAAQHGRVLLDSDSNESGSIVNEEPPLEAVDQFLKIDDIKGESDDKADGDPDRPVTTGDVSNSGSNSEAQHDQTDLEFIRERAKVLPSEVGGDGEDIGSAQKASDDDASRGAKKPKEIVVVGSKVREAQANGLEVRGWDPVSKEVVLKTEDIITEEDLTDYAEALLASGEDISSISVRDDVIGLTFDQQVKLLGLFSIRMEQHVDVSADSAEEGRVKVKFPWWAFLAKKDISADAIKVAVEDELKKDNVAEQDPDSLQTRQEVQELQTLGNTMKTLHDTAMAIIRKIGS